MADGDLVIPDDLKQRFVQFGQIAALTQIVQGKIDKINKDNRDAGGHTDRIAKAYHSQIDSPTQDLSTLVGEIATMFGLTSDNGVEATNVLNHGEDDAQDQANSW